MTIVFDFDGVLADSLVPVTSSIDAALRAHGFDERGAEELRRFIGPPTFVAFSELLGLPATDPLVAEVVGTYRFFAAVAAASPNDADDDKTAIVARALAETDSRSGAMVGDRRYDMEAAHAHGLRALGVAWGIGTEEELRAAGAEEIAATPAELRALLSSR